MKVITLYQPWATLLAIGAEAGGKGNETRSWTTKHRGEILIHASKKFTKEQRELCEEEPFRTALEKNGYLSPDDLPLGAIVGYCEIVDCVKITPMNAPPYPEIEFGDYTPGRYYWATKNNRIIEPIPAKGYQRIWNFDIKHLGRLKHEQNKN